MPGLYLQSRKKERGKLARNVSVREWGGPGSSFDLSTLPPEVDEIVDEFMGLLKTGAKTNDRIYKSAPALLDDLRRGRWAGGRILSRSILLRYLKLLRTSKIFSNGIRLGKFANRYAIWPLLYYEVHSQKSLRPVARDLATMGVVALIKKYLAPKLFSILIRAAFPQFLALTIISMIIAEIFDSILPEDFLSWGNAMSVEYVRNKVNEEESKTPETRYEKWSDPRFADYEIEGFSGSETFSGGFLFNLSLRYKPANPDCSDFRELDIQSLVGQSISWGVQGARPNFLGLVEFGAHGGRFQMEHVTHKYRHPVPPTRWFHGRIQAVHMKEGGQLTLMVGSFLDELSINIESNVYRNKSAVEIVEEILQRAFPKGNDASLSWEINIKDKAAYRKREQCIQYRESALNFLERLLESEGIWYFFKHEADKHVLIIGDTLEKVGGAVCDYPVLRGEAPKGISDCVAIIEFEKAETEVAGPGLSQYYNSANARCLNMSPKKGLPGIACETYYPELRDEESVAGERNRLGQELAWESLLRHGHGNCFMFSLTDWIIPVALDQWKVEQVIVYANAPVNPIRTAIHTQTDQFRVMSIEHASQKGVYANSFDALPKLYTENEKKLGCEAATTVEFRPVRQALRPQINGVLPAIVAPGIDMAAWPSRNQSDSRAMRGFPEMDEKGRISLQFPWLYKSDEKPLTVYAGLSQPWSGAGYGTRFVPPIGREVFVAFIDGDPDQPVILACGPSPGTALPFDKDCTGIRFPSKDEKCPNEGAAILYDSAKDGNTLMIRSPEMQTDVAGDYFQTVGGETVIRTDAGLTIQAGDCSLQMKNGKISLEIDGNGVEIKTEGVWVNGKKVHLNDPSHAPKTEDITKASEKTKEKSKR